MSDELTSLFGKNLKRIRKARKLTQEMLADISQSSPVYISEVESGKKSPTLAFIDKLCASLEIKPVDFFDFSEVSGSELKQLEETFFVLLRKASKDKNILKQLKFAFGIIKESIP